MIPVLNKKGEIIQVLFLQLTLIILFFANNLVAQVPADKDTIYIAGSTLTAGNNLLALETTINGDTTSSGERINPNRVYALYQGQIYFQTSPIYVNDPYGTLSIISVPDPDNQTAKEKPIILIVPASNSEVGSNKIYGSIRLDNIYYQTMQMDGHITNELFYCGTRNNLPQKLIINNCLFEFCNIDLFDCSNESGAIGGWPYGASFFITNSYFRNMFNPSQWWGSRIFQCNHPIDTLWIENCTITTAGLTFLQENALTDFAYINHNTIVNNTKYWLLNTFYLNYFVTNNIFINQNWVGEDTNIVSTGTNPDYSFHSTINLDSVTDPIYNPVVQQKYYADNSLHYTDDVNPNNMKVFVSNNVNYYDTILIQDYYKSNVYINNTTGTIPSYLTWLGLGSGPWKIENIPCEWMNTRTKKMFEKYSPKNGGGFVADSAWTGNPKTQTNCIADLSVVNLMAQWNQNQWADPKYPNPPDIVNSKYIYGDYNPSTLPGIINGVKTDSITKNGPGIQVGITKFTDLQENFSQTTYYSSIDKMPVGSLIWNDENNSLYEDKSKNFIHSVEFNLVKAAYINEGGNVSGIFKRLPNLIKAYSLKQNYPNPFNPSTTIQYNIPVFSHVNLDIYDILGRRIETLVNSNKEPGHYFVIFKAKNLASGVYFYRLKAGTFVEIKKLVIMK